MWGKELQRDAHDFYFGYGSNLDRDDWAQFCSVQGADPDILRPPAPAVLPDEKLVFDYHSSRRQCGALNIRRSPGHQIEGYLFAVSRYDWAVLDAKEGAPHRYTRARVTVIDGAGRKIHAQTYRVVERMRQGFVAPSAAYLAICHAGRVRYGLPTEPLERAAAGQH